jgi:2-desacetyl-2-hydroxyethyl bacteriochlorophyllide A dehydrogenase
MILKPALLQRKERWRCEEMPKMTAARLHEIGQKLRVDSIEIPEIGVSDVLVSVKAAGICHSDINYRDGIAPVAKLPITLGHEIAGVVAKAGAKVRTISEGDGVCIHYVLSCGHCQDCTSNRENYCKEYQMIGKDVDGGLAEYVRIPARNLLKLPASIPYEQGAILGCAVSTAFHALRRGRIAQGEAVVVYGVGGLGAHAVQLAARVFGAARIIAVDLTKKKLDLAKRFGATDVVDASTDDPAEKVEEATGGKFAGLVLDFVGRSVTIEKAIQCVRKGGRLVIVGIGSQDIRLSPYRTLIGREMELIGVNDHLRVELAELIELAASRKLDLSSSVTHKIQLEQANLGMQMLEEEPENVLRIVATP